MIPAPKRRWFQFSLRTLLVVVTVVGCWLGYELNWIRQRHEFVNQRVSPAEHLLYPREVKTGQVAAKAPGVLGLFEERGHAYISIYVSQGGLSHPPDAKRELEMAQRLFPEARVTCTIEPDWPATH